MILAQLSIAPVGTSISLHESVQHVIDVLKKEQVSFQTNAMATILEVETLTQLFSVVEKAHNAVIDAGAQRVITELKIDDRRDKNVTLHSKTSSLRF